MSIRSGIFSELTSRFLSEESLNRRRRLFERARSAKGASHVVEYFHQADDPYSHLMVQVLGDLAARFDVTITPWLCSPPADEAAPDRERLVAYSHRDAARLARKAGLECVFDVVQPEPVRLAEVEAQLASSIERGAFLTDAPAIGTAMWQGRPLENRMSSPNATRLRAQGDLRRRRQGHYLGATLFYGGEWYWGLDRLHYLEARLAALGAQRSNARSGFTFSPPSVPTATRVEGSARVDLDFFMSFRSPYSYIAAERAKALADAYGAKLRLRFVLPMVMRGMKVPMAKGRYISMDTAREARRIGAPFGRIADPVGRPVERGYSLLPWAITQDKGYEYALSFMRGVWSEGIDAGEDTGMQRIVERSGLDWADARKRIGNDAWRPEAERNRLDLLRLGLWGVPCFRFGNTAVWGQDRLWVIEDAMLSCRNVSP